MAEKRRVTRINLVLAGIFRVNDTAVDCHLENLSMEGALIATRGPSLGEVKVGDICTLQIPQETESLNLTIQAEVVHHLFPFVGLKFFGLNLQGYSVLEYVIQKERERQAFLGAPDTPCRSTPGSLS